MDPTFRQRVDEADALPELFDLVKQAVEEDLGRSRAGLMLGLARLGFSPRGWIGGYFVAGSNAIVLNGDLLDYVRAQDQARYNAYVFQLMLHEYLHTLGVFDEARVRELVHGIAADRLGDDHPATRFAAAMRPGGRASAPDYVRDVVHPRVGKPPGDPQVEILRGFDLDATPYIQ